MQREFSDKTVVVTGASHGIGRAIAVAFAEQGANLWICDVRETELKETASACLQAGGGCSAHGLDVSDPEAVDAFIQTVESGSGPAEILVNNAGGVLGQIGRPLEEVSPEDWNAIFAVNTSGAFYLSQAVAPAMKRAGWGRIINISSGAGLGISLTGIQAYAAAKAAQIGLTRQLAHELGPWGITVNNVAPGFVLSNPTTKAQWDSYGEEGQTALVNGIAVRRLGRPEEIAYGVLFFASEKAAWITGQVLSVDGGK